MGRYTNESGLPDPIYRAVAEDDYDRGDADISVTSLIDSPRVAALKELHKDEIVEDVADFANSLIGKAVHAYLNRFTDGELDDKTRLYVEIDGWVVSGQTDCVVTLDKCGECGFAESHMIETYDGLVDIPLHYGDDGHQFVPTVEIWDWKTPSVSEAKYGLKRERIEQLNCYALLLDANGYHVDALKACLITKNWSPYDVGLADHSIVVREVPLWPMQDTYAYMQERVRLHQEARSELPRCTDDERWVEPSKYAVIKEGNTRAVKGGLHDSEEEAEAHAAELGMGYTVEERLGDPTPKRCWLWKCAVRDYCDQAQEDVIG